MAAKAIVVDNTSAFRLKDGIPLVVPEVNPEQIKKHIGIIANPNCSTIIMNVPVWPLHKANRVKRIIVSTYQAVSGAGAWGLYELDAQLKSYAAGEPIVKQKFPHQIAGNIFSHNTKIADNGYNEEENKMVLETRKIFGEPKMMVTATCIRVPVPRAHSESINLEFERPITPDQVREILRHAPGVRIVDDREANYFPMPLEASGQGQRAGGSDPPGHEPGRWPRNRAVCQRGSDPQRGGDQRGADRGEADLSIGTVAPCKSNQRRSHDSSTAICRERCDALFSGLGILGHFRGECAQPGAYCSGL